MIISEKQIMKLIGATHTLIAICDSCGDKRKDMIDAVIENGSEIAALLADITNQQSDTLRTIE
jgi:hypothetical protein